MKLFILIATLLSLDLNASAPKKPSITPVLIAKADCPWCDRKIDAVDFNGLAAAHHLYSKRTRSCSLETTSVISYCYRDPRLNLYLESYANSLKATANLWEKGFKCQKCPQTITKILFGSKKAGRELIFNDVIYLHDQENMPDIIQEFGTPGVDYFE